MLSKECEKCGVEIIKQFPSQLKKIRFCRECGFREGARQSDRKIIKKCIVCGNEYKVKRSHLNHRLTCSRKCGGKLHSQRMSGENHPRWKKIKSPTKKYNWIQGRYAHRLVMERYLNRELDSSEIVHHINENPKDNRIENLQLLTRAEHFKLHKLTINHDNS